MELATLSDRYGAFYAPTFFAPGNPGGPGRPKGRGYLLQKAAQEALSEEHIQAIIKKAARLALEGDMTAARLVLERTCGRPPEPPAAPFDFEFPDLSTPKACAAALDLVAKGVCAGTCDRDTARILIDLVQTRLKAIDSIDLDQRLTEVEKQARLVEAAHGRNGRHR
jgi:hypothetical protein